MILHSDAVVRVLEKYSEDVPEVPLRYREDRHGIIIIVPKTFDSVPDLSRAVAYASINEMMSTLKLLGTNPRIEIGNF